jgi:hypothetical protein
MLKNGVRGPLKKISNARRAFIVIVSVKRDRDFRTSTTTYHENELEQGESFKPSVRG